MLLMIDNYDSFTFNLVQYFGELGEEIEVKTNDGISLEEIGQNPRIEKIVISPGPGTPDNAGISMDVVDHFGGKKPILGVCLGHQAIAQVYGGTIVRAPEPIHGKPSDVKHDDEGLFKGVSNPFEAGRYHSLIVEKESFPDELQITAETPDGIVMGLRHKDLALHGVQFHPESILTAEGKKLLQNFISI